MRAFLDLLTMFNAGALAGGVVACVINPNSFVAIWAAINLVSLAIVTIVIIKRGCHADFHQ